MKYIALEEHYLLPEQEPQATDGFPPELNAQLNPLLHDITDTRLAEMDKHDIRLSVLSPTVPGVQQAGLSAQDAIDLARRSNDWLAEQIADHRDRLRGFAALPLQDPGAAVAELERCVREHGFLGALVNDQTDGHYLDESQYEPVWEAFEALQVPLYLHPNSDQADRWHVLDGYPEMRNAMWSWAPEVSGHAVRLICSGLFDRHPNARVILGHAGEMLPFQMTRLDSRYGLVVKAKPIQRRPSEYLGANVMATMSGIFLPPAISAAAACIGADAFMFSVDYPYEHTSEAVAAFEAAELTDEDRDMIAHANAERILGL